MELERDGFEIRRGAISAEHVDQIRSEISRIQQEDGIAACVREVFQRSPLIRSLVDSEEMRSLVPDDRRPVRCLIFDKTPDSNWPVAWHQDLTISVAEKGDVPGYSAWSKKDGTHHVQPPIALLENMVTVRLHIDDTPPENGALRVLPGSHLEGRISSEGIAEVAKDAEVACACSSGDALLMKPLVLHASSRSAVPGHRRVLHVEFARDEDLDDALAWHVR